MTTFNHTARLLFAFLLLVVTSTGCIRTQFAVATPYGGLGLTLDETGPKFSAGLNTQSLSAVARGRFMYQPE